jgi:hypothetical protein
VEATVSGWFALTPRRRRLACFAPKARSLSGLVQTASSETEQSGRSKARRFSLFAIALAIGVLGYFAFRTMRGLMLLGSVDSAISRVRAISAAETQFAKEHPELGYTCELSHLPQSEGITRLITKGRIDNGYAFEVIGCRAAIQKPNSTYQITARPLHFGAPAFCSDPSGILMFDEGGSVEKCLAKRNPYQ